MARKDKWLFTINNPLAEDKAQRFDHETIKKLVYLLPSVTYWCMSDEIGNETHTYHTHVFINMVKGVDFNRIKLLFPTAHIEMCKGTQTENKEYILKEGKWKDDPKNDTRVEGTFYEEGEIIEKYKTTREKLESQDLEKAVQEWIEQIEQGKQVYEIVRSDYRAFRYQYQLHKYREDLEVQILKQQQMDQYYAEEQEKQDLMEKQYQDEEYSKKFEKRYTDLMEERWRKEAEEAAERKKKQKEYREKGRKKNV